MDLPTPHSTPQKSKLPLAEIHLHLDYLFSKILWERFYYGLERSEVLSRVRLFLTPWTVAHQVPPSMEFSRQEY